MALTYRIIQQFSGAHDLQLTTEWNGSPSSWPQLHYRTSALMARQYVRKGGGSSSRFSKILVGCLERSSRLPLAAYAK